ncbi:MAG: hypothetical protein BGO29_06000 [Bacteroidales bacterium 36-12]|nr:MAG: hypothetical protein BGO29_06000 [Bacteroidales bacterium 36-12]
MTSCSDNTENYYISITNNYFEPLYDIQIGNIQFDFLLVNQTSTIKLIDKGYYEFSCVTESNLLLTAKIDLKGSVDKVRLVVDESGRLSK